MVAFFQNSTKQIFACQVGSRLSDEAIAKLKWLFDDADFMTTSTISGDFVGVRKEMVSPWSTNAVEITRNMGIFNIKRIESFTPKAALTSPIDPMLQRIYSGLDQEIFTIAIKAERVALVTDIATYNEEEGLALSEEEIDYLKNVSEKLNRPLTDSEVFGFSQVNSEHCRHKIFNGQFIIDGIEKTNSLFKLIKKTAKENPELLVSAYKDNVAFIEGPEITNWAPQSVDKATFFQNRKLKSVLSIKAETHNFPTTVEPFNGAATGSGGEIRDRLAGGIGSLPLSGSAVYMTAYSRLTEDRCWEKQCEIRDWKYQSPTAILIKASNGASDFGNKFGQPLINGSVITFEHDKGDITFGFDKVIMLAGGIGYGKLEDAQKKQPKKGDKIIVLGGDNYRIGMGGSAVSSVATGEFGNQLELNAIQRSNPEMQKRVANVIRAFVEGENNPIVSIHDHGAGGHLNCLSELVEETGGVFDLDAFPIGDETLSLKELLSNESQERIGLVIHEKDLPLLESIAKRERAPMFVVGTITEDNHLVFESKKENITPVDWPLDYLLGSSPKTILKDNSFNYKFPELSFEANNIKNYVYQLLQLEAVACKDWLTNKVDRCVTGKVAKQQTVGEIQLPLNNLGVMKMDFESNIGIATATGHAPAAALIDPEKGSRLSVAESITNLMWAPLTHGKKGVTLSANWMWPAKKEGENDRLYRAVEALSDYVIQLGIKVPTGKDSLSMKQVYPDGKTVYSPGTVIVSAMAEVNDVNKTIEPVIDTDVKKSTLIYVDFSDSAFEIGGSSFAQIIGQVGTASPDAAKAETFIASFEAIQQLVEQRLILAGHDIGSGGLITTLLEMNFPNTKGGMTLDLTILSTVGMEQILFSEQPACVLQVEAINEVTTILEEHGANFIVIGKTVGKRVLEVKYQEHFESFDINEARDYWRKTSFLLDQKQTTPKVAEAREANYKKQPLAYHFPKTFDGTRSQLIKRKGSAKIKAGIIREKGVNSDREMAYMLHLGGFEVKDVHMTDLMTGAEDLSDLNFIVFVGGFSNSDVLGSGKGWAGTFRYNEKAKQALKQFYERTDTMSLGVCNGCQTMMELGLVMREMGETHPKMHHNDSEKFECHFVAVDIKESASIMLKPLVGSTLGVWSAHGEGKFVLFGEVADYDLPMSFKYDTMPGNPNGSDFSAAAMSSKDGRHLVMMPHLERSIFPINWPYYAKNRQNDEVSPWCLAITAAYEWILKKNKVILS